jgi:Tfp pilus assembly protein PilP
VTLQFLRKYVPFSSSSPSSERVPGLKIIIQREKNRTHHQADSALAVFFRKCIIIAIEWAHTPMNREKRSKEMKRLKGTTDLFKPSQKCLSMLACLILAVLMVANPAWSQTQAPPTPGPTPPQGDRPSVASPQPSLAPSAPSAAPSSKESARAAEIVREALMKENFAYAPSNMLDPFIPFIAPTETTAQPRESEEEETDLALEHKKPLTPLQKMTVPEIEKGLRAITWGEMGRRAVIEDGAGKGYIVSVGTPAGDRNGVVTEIFNDRLVIQQEIWDKDAKRMIPQNSIVKLKKDVKPN